MRGPIARIVKVASTAYASLSGKTIFEEGVFNSVPRGTCTTSAEAEQWLCLWESQMDHMERTKMGEPLSLFFPIRSSARSLRSEDRPHGSFPRKKGSTLLLSSSEEVDGEDVDELSQSVIFAQAYCELI